ncbi:MAG TPA: VOC family protein [Actinomycetota bacterium]|nr:VOC family protein [Actinomycetota bacterium]
MRSTLQVTIDCRDPASLAEFWAAALGYEVEAPRPADADVVARRPELAGSWAAARDPSGARPRLYFQRVPEPKVAKNRVHLDVGVADMDAEVARLTALGARVVRAPEVSAYGETWTVLTDPEGNEFCVQPTGGPSGGV